MELRQLRYFLAVAQELHFGRAAQRVHIAQSPLSRQIKQLEDSIGITLFNRSKHRVELTEAGRAFVAEARTILESTERARLTAMKAAAGMSGRIIIGYTNSAIYTLFPHLLTTFRQRYPQVEIVLRDNLLTPLQTDALVDRKLDIGFLRPPVSTTALETLIIAKQTLMLACSPDHPLAQSGDIDLSDFAEQPFVMFSRNLNSALATTLLRICHEAGFLPRIAQEVGDIPTMISLVASGMGVALVPSSAQSIGTAGVVFLKINGCTEELAMAMAWKRDAESPARDSFIQLAKDWTNQGLPFRNSIQDIATLHDTY